MKPQTAKRRLMHRGRQRPSITTRSPDHPEPQDPIATNIQGLQVVRATSELVLAIIDFGCVNP
jgi:hypothetical protein